MTYQPILREVWRPRLIPLLYLRDRMRSVSVNSYRMS